MKKFILATIISIWIMTAFWVVAQEAKPTDEKPVLSAVEGRPLVLDKAPVRIIHDPYPTFSGIDVNPATEEVTMCDDNRRSIMTYSRSINVKGVAEPRRQIIGPKAKFGTVCGLKIDPVNQEIFAVSNDTMDNMVVFPVQAKGNVSPLRELRVDHGARDTFVDLEHNEVAVLIEHVNKVTIYRRAATGEEAPLRIIQGPNTKIANPHGVFIDIKADEIFVTNQGSWRKVETGYGYNVYSFKKKRLVYEDRKAESLSPSTGKFLPPSITVYSRTAQGDAAPLRIIEGLGTQLNLPGAIYVDTTHNEIIVANLGANSILFFQRTAKGDVKPVRVIEGPATGLKYPSGISIDNKNDELWVSNWGNHTATVFPRTAKGNVTPLRTIAAAPTRFAGLVNPGSIAYDPIRKEILVNQ